MDSSSLEQCLAKLKELFGDRASDSMSIREQHSHDESWHVPRLPDVVVSLLTTEEVSAAVRVCNQFDVPMIAFGAGTGLEGNVNAVRGGVSFDLNGMNQILTVHSEDLDVVIQPGVRRIQLNEYLKTSGLFFPVDPGADATLGGMAATRASGTAAVKYGTMKDNVLALEVVLPDGKIIRTANRAKKSSAGYDLTRLMIGSEGTLGIITELTLRLQGIPEAMAAAICSFPSLDKAVQTVITIIQSGVSVARVELLDDLQVKGVNNFSALGLPERNTLFFEFHGTPSSVKEQAEYAQAISSDHGGEDFVWKTTPEERSQLWKARHNVAYACKTLRPGAELWATDVCVPISRLADCINETKEDLVNSFLLAPIVGHVGDGNFHLTILIDRSDPKEIEEAHRLNKRLIKRALEMDGTCTGEHGVGIGKAPYLRDELGDAIDVMQQIKRAIDPKNLMNPGKIFIDGDAGLHS